MSNKKKIIISGFLLLILLTFCLPFLVSCSGDGTFIEGVNGTSIVNLIFPNVWVFLATILATIILLSAVIWFVWKPMNKKLDERKKFMNDELQSAEKAKMQALEFEKSANDKMLDANSMASNIISEANKKADHLYDELTNVAKRDAYQILKNAGEQIEFEKKQMQKDMNEQLMDISFEAVTHISKQKITKAENDQLVKEFIENFKNDKTDITKE